MLNCLKILHLILVLLEVTHTHTHTHCAVEKTDRLSLLRLLVSKKPYSGTADSGAAVTRPNTETTGRLCIGYTHTHGLCLTSPFFWEYYFMLCWHKSSEVVLGVVVSVLFTGWMACPSCRPTSSVNARTVSCLRSLRCVTITSCSGRCLATSTSHCMQTPAVVWLLSVVHDFNASPLPAVQATCYR